MESLINPAYLPCFSKIAHQFPGICQQNAPLKPFTSFKIGGNADLLVQPKTTNEIQKVISIAKEHRVPYRIMGHGSNLLVDDLGVRGIVIRLGENFSTITTKENLLTAQSGASLAAITKKAAQNGLSGIHCLCGIPGSFGGAVYMNAGAYGQEVEETLLFAKALNSQGAIITLSKEDMKFSYRHSLLQEERFVFLEGTFGLEQGSDTADLLAKMKELNLRRNEKQPMNYPSAGSTFKRPQGNYASALIDKCNLKGTQIGGAMVSLKHAGFIVNTGNATAKDVKDLIALVQQKVYDGFHVALEPEIRIWEP